MPTSECVNTPVLINVFIKLIFILMCHVLLPFAIEVITLDLMKRNDLSPSMWNYFLVLLHLLLYLTSFCEPQKVIIVVKIKTIIIQAISDQPHQHSFLYSHSSLCAMVLQSCNIRSENILNAMNHVVNIRKESCKLSAFIDRETLRRDGERAFLKKHKNILLHNCEATWVYV